MVTLGANGVEFVVHPYEVGCRLAKDMLFTGAVLSAQEAYQFGMIQPIFPRETLEDETLELAADIASRPGITLAMAKRSVNQA